ncbi:MAG: hypothetical protein AAF529_08865 [Pseudomonadota bacterium]
MVAAVVDVNFVDSSATTYYAGMADFEVMSLASVTPANGNATLADATPAEWLGEGDPAGNANAGNAPNVVEPWCGGAENPLAYELLIDGSGHDDGAINATYSYGFAAVGASQYQGVSLATPASALAIVPTDASMEHDPYPDGLPGARHSYQGQQYDATLGKIVRSGGSVYRRGFNVGKTWFHNGTTWSQGGTIPIPFGGGRVHCSGRHNASSKSIWGQDGSSDFAILNHATESWGGVLGTGIPQLGRYPIGAVNQTNGEFLIMDANGWSVLNVNWAGNSITSAQSVSMAGWGGAGGGGLWWDSRDGSYWGMDDTNVSTIYKITGSGTSRTATAHALTGDPIVNQGVYRGIFSRGVLMPDISKLGIVTHSRQPGYLISLPSI